MKSTTQSVKAKLAKAEKAAKPDYAGKIARALELQAEIAAKAQEFDEIKQFFHDEFADNMKTTEVIATDAGVAMLKTSNTYKVAPEKVEDLKNIFGTTYGSFVSEKTTYGATAGLKKLLANADYEYADTIREAVIITTSKSVQFTAPKN